MGIVIEQSIHSDRSTSQLWTERFSNVLFGYAVAVNRLPVNTLHSPLAHYTDSPCLLLAPKDQISRVAKMLADEYGTASNIKSRVNRLSVLGAITSTQQRLKLYNKGMFAVTLRHPSMALTHFPPDSSSKWSGRVLRNHRYGRRQRKACQY